MEISQMAAVQIAGTAALAQQGATMAMVKNAAKAQMQMANMIAEQAAQVNPQQSFSIYV